MEGGYRRPAPDFGHFPAWRAPGAARSCLLLAVQCAGADIGTVEGLAAGRALHPLQEAFTREHALQCGFCTPGFLMLLAGELAADPDLDRDEQRLAEVLASKPVPVHRIRGDPQGRNRRGADDAVDAVDAVACLTLGGWPRRWRNAR